MPGVDFDLCSKAVESLLEYERKKGGEREAKSLLGSYSKPVFATVQLKKEIAKPVLKPVRVKIPHSFFAPEENDDTICLFCRSEDKSSIAEFIEKNPIAGLTKIVSLNDLKKQYKQIEDRRTLFKEHTNFLCDMRIVVQLYNLLGKTFISRHSNCPVPISYSNVHGLPAAVHQSASSSYMHLKGININIKLGTTIMTSKKIVQNVEQGISFAIDKLHGGWKDVASIHLKTSDSPALPIFSKVQSEAFLFMSTEVKKAKDAKAKVVTDKKDDPEKAIKTKTKTGDAQPVKVSVAKASKTKPTAKGR